MNSEKRKMTIILLRLARALNTRQAKLWKQGCKVNVLALEIENTLKALNEVHQLTLADPIEHGVYMTAISFVIGDISMKQCLEGIEECLGRVDAQSRI